MRLGRSSVHGAVGSEPPRARAAADVHAERAKHLELDASTPLASWMYVYVALRERARYRNTKSERVAVRTHVAGDAVGAVPLGKLGEPELRAWWSRLVTKRAIVPHRRRASTRPISASTVSNVLSLVRCALEEARARGFIASNPARDLFVPRPLEATTELALDGVLEPDEQLAMLGALERRRRRLHVDGTRAQARDALVVECMVKVALGAGLRRGELLHLRWEDVDLVRLELAVRFGRKGKPTKGGKPRRVPLFGLALDAIRLLASSHRAPLVFCGARGGRRKTPPMAEFRAALAEAGVTRRVRFHDLRHTCATSLLEGWWGRRWTTREVQDLLGHASITTTERYVHGRGTLLRAAAAEAREIGHLPAGATRPLTPPFGCASLERVGTPVGESERRCTERDTGLEVVRPVAAPRSDPLTPLPPSRPARKDTMTNGSRDFRSELLAYLRDKRSVVIDYTHDGHPCAVIGRIERVARDHVFLRPASGARESYTVVIDQIEKLEPFVKLEPEPRA